MLRSSSFNIPGPPGVLKSQYIIDDAKYKYDVRKPGIGDYIGGQRAIEMSAHPVNKTVRKAEIISMNSLNMETERDSARIL